MKHATKRNERTCWCVGVGGGGVLGFLLCVRWRVRSALRVVSELWAASEVGVVAEKEVSLAVESRRVKSEVGSESNFAKRKETERMRGGERRRSS